MPAFCCGRQSAEQKRKAAVVRALGKVGGVKAAHQLLREYHALHGTDGQSTAQSQGAAPDCPLYKVRKDGVRAAALSPQQLTNKTLTGLRQALGPRADGFVFVNADQFPVAAADEDATPLGTVTGPGCTIRMASGAGASDADPSPLAVDWKAVFIQNNLLRGLALGPKGPTAAPKQMFQWVPSRPNFAVQDRTYVATSDAETVTDATYATSGFMGASALVKDKALDKAGSQKASGKSHSQESLKVVQYMYPRVVLWPRASLELHPQCLADLSRALRGRDAAARVAGVLEEYGRYYPLQVTLGGKLYDVKTASQYAQEYHNKTRTKKKKTTTDTEYNRTGSGEASASSMEVRGGNVLLADDADQWSQSLLEPQYWAVLQYGPLLDTVEMLPVALRAQVHAALSGSQ